MFTGLIKEIGKVKSIQSNAEGKVLEINCSALLGDIAIDDSVAVNGVCQTATEVGNSSFKVQAVHATLEKTTFNELRVGDEVNLELALRPIDRLGGHFVQGHVNGVSKISSIINKGKNYLVTVKTPSELSRYLMDEGSITIDGISLTIYKKLEGAFQVSVIPHTWDHTILKNKRNGSTVNLEVDVLAKYVENLLMNSNSQESTKFSKQWFSERGFHDL